jgi:ribonuclease R
LFVRLPETGAEGLVPARSLGYEFFRHDERLHALIGERSGTKYGLGNILPVRLVEAAPLTGGLRFELAGANTPAQSQKPKTPWANRRKLEDRKKRQKRR